MKSTRRRLHKRNQTTRIRSLTQRSWLYVLIIRQRVENGGGFCEAVYMYHERFIEPTVPTQHRRIGFIVCSPNNPALVLLHVSSPVATGIPAFPVMFPPPTTLLHRKHIRDALYKLLHLIYLSLRAFSCFFQENTLIFLLFFYYSLSWNFISMMRVHFFLKNFHKNSCVTIVIKVWKSFYNCYR